MKNSNSTNTSSKPTYIVEVIFEVDHPEFRDGFMYRPTGDRYKSQHRLTSFKAAKACRENTLRGEWDFEGEFACAVTVYRERQGDKPGRVALKRVERTRKWRVLGPPSGISKWAVSGVLT